MHLLYKCSHRAFRFDRADLHDRILDPTVGYLPTYDPAISLQREGINSGTNNHDILLIVSPHVSHRVRASLGV